MEQVLRLSWLWPTIIILSAIASGLVTFVIPGTPLRPIVVMWFLFICPGMVLIRFLRLHEAIVEWTLALALSFVIDAIVAGIQSYAGRWSPTATLIIVMGLSSVCAFMQLITMLPALNGEQFIKRLCNQMVVLRILAVISIVLLNVMMVLITRHNNNVKRELYASVPQPLGQSGNWNLVFDDEFNGTSLDATKWVQCFPWGTNAGCGSSTTPQSWNLPSNVIVSRGTLKLRAQNQPITENGTIYPYTSGMISTGPWDNTGSAAKFAFTYGYAEIRAKVPKGHGLWPAFWTLPTDDNWPPEIDASEIITGSGQTTYTNTMSYHYIDATSATNQSSGANWTSHVDLASGFHVYAVDWEPGRIHWYVDGVERRSAFTDSKNITAKPMYLLIQLEIGGSWAGSPDSRTPFPSFYEVDYVRVWQHCTTNCPTAGPTPKLYDFPTS